MADNSTIPDLSVYILTFNCGLSPIDIDAFASQLFAGVTTSTPPDILALSLQEIAPIPKAFIGGTFLVPYFSRFYHAVQKAAYKLSNSSASPIYTPIAARNLGLTGIMLFAKDAEAIQNIETGGVGVGIAEMGNKGAVGVRFTYQRGGSSTELTFIAAHLAAMESELKRRNEDWKNIVRGLVFKSTASDSKENATSLSAEARPLLSISPRDSSIYKPTSHLFVAGDLNYRTSTLSPAPNDHADTFPQPHNDRSSPNHFSVLFENDQLNQERRAGRTCHGLIEAPVTFPPTYKYDSREPFLTPDEDLSQWHWAKHRWPSWCDRILYLDIPSWLSATKPGVKITTHKYSALPLMPTSDHRPVTLEVSIPLVPIPSPSEDEEGDDPRISPPFEINVDWKSRRDRARILELVVGFSMYCTTTLEGAGIVVAMVVGAAGAYFAIRSMLDI
ncbi:hypothetical protein G7Y89_g11778 [Cudoniella acicularis]|uniref:Inositol polyphosphate-related phosphatase domain-containing protein n=1 Tax=Cudoniella acicularis TaxID=354080 RepID=A0A8H4RBC8_9HELO|nr:hypothetical protein G7Y89_g11778 [Cudoniella acicularis]